MEENLLITPLHASHVALGAKMSPFAGFDMPIQYSSILNEHEAVRTAVGMFDVSHMGEIFVSGPDAERYVNHVFTNFAPTEPGKIVYGMLLKEDGGTVDDLLVYREAEPQHYLLVVNAANIAKDFAHLKAHAGGFDVKIDNQSEYWGQIALQGPGAEKIAVEVLGETKAPSLGFYEFYDSSRGGKRMIVSRTGYTGEDGFELYASPEATVELWNTLLKAGVVPCGLGCRDTLRFEAGLPLYGDELSDQISPVEAGLGMFCKLDKEFVGRDALAAQKAEGVKQKVVGLEIEGKAVARAGYPVLTPEGAEVGVVTTGYHSPSLGKSLCFALVDAAHAALGTPLAVQVRTRSFPCVVVKKRFYQPNYKK